MGEDVVPVNPWLILPFGVLLALIALGPLLCPAWWGRNYPKVALGLGVLVIAYYGFGLKQPARILHTAREYVGFIALIGSLFVVAGGIHINVKSRGAPLGNVIFLFAGAILANVLGTTGASMLLIRPWLRMNRQRIASHHIVFFIFIVSNVGGCLTPIGDPPLFLGYLAGVPFWWVTRSCLPMWAVGVGLLLIMFAVLDSRHFRRAPRDPAGDSVDSSQWRVDGIGNLFFLFIILMAVFVDEPIFLREGLMVVAAAGSYFTTPKTIHDANHFNFHPIQEVAVLFAGIFATMMPALDWLQDHTRGLEATTPGFFYWACGGLSSTLDNAPTYLCFLKALFGRYVDPDVVAQVQELVRTHGAGLAGLTGAHADEARRAFATLQKYQAAEVARGTVDSDHIAVAVLLGKPRLAASLLAISIASVFFGANTYIGNGPNFMVKSMAEQQKATVPGFLAYILRYALPFMLPVLVIVWWLFFRQ